MPPDHASPTSVHISQSVLRCHIAAFEAMGGVPEEILYDRMKTAVVGEDEAGVITYNAHVPPRGACPFAVHPDNGRQ
jgi:transposase